MFYGGGCKNILLQWNFDNLYIVTYRCCYRVFGHDGGDGGEGTGGEGCRDKDEDEEDCFVFFIFVQFAMSIDIYNNNQRPILV